MRSFAKVMFSTVRDETFFESCGVTDLIATCYGGRNHLVAMEFAKNEDNKTFDELERDMLNGQKLQGILTSDEVQTVLQIKGWERQYPLFTAVNAISRGLFKPKDIARYREVASSPKLRADYVSKSERRLSILEAKIDL